MPRGRAALTEKEERILIQSQLMGLTPSNMVRIGNRLKALEKEAQDIAEINEACAGFAWDVLKDPTRQNEKAGWIVMTPEDNRIEFVRKKKKSHWGGYEVAWDIRVTKPGTRYKPRVIKDKSLHVDYNWRAKFCPGGSKELYSCIRFCKHIKWELQLEESV